jgi:RNA polymerase sigma-B factor
MAADGVMVAPKSPRDAEALLRTYRRTRDPGIREQLVRAYLPLVHAVARRYIGRGELLEDLVQVGALGLLEAIDRFDPERSVGLGTLALPTITGRIKNHLRDRTSSVRVPRDLAELSREARRSNEELAARLSRAPTLVELARHLDVAPQTLARALESDHAFVPAPLAAADASGALEPVDDPFRLSEDRILLAVAFRVLGQRERRILHLRFFEDLSQAEVAAAVGLSQVQVSRLIAASLARMRAALRPDQLAAGSAR